MEKSEKELLADISTKLDTLIGMAAAAGKSQEEQIRVLRGLGHDWPAIGKLVGLEPDTARKRLARNGKSKSPK